MPGKQAKTLSRQRVIAALRRARRGRYPQRDRVMILLSVKAGCSLCDVQQLAGHRSIEQTQAYIDASARAKRRLIELI